MVAAPSASASRHRVVSIPTHLVPEVARELALNADEHLNPAQLEFEFTPKVDCVIGERVGEGERRDVRRHYQRLPRFFLLSLT
jgi:hypothetical protein